MKKIRQLKQITLFCLFFIFSSVSIAQVPVLWGVASAGGAFNKGSIFKVNGDGTNFSVVHSFDSINGSVPRSSLCLANNGNLYGMCQFGGAHNAGILYVFNPSNSTFSKILDFDNLNGGYPWGTMIKAANGMLYGSTYGGGTGGGGIIFRLNPNTHVYSILYGLNQLSDGGSITDKLLEASNGKLYGMAAYGGANGEGTIFSFDPSNNTFTKLHDFNGINGGTPYGSLLEATDGFLYGMTYDGGSNNKGVFFKLQLSTGIFTKIFDFNGTNGNNPWNSLIQVTPTKLYGMCSSATASGGIIFEYDLLTGMAANVYSFNFITDGFIPWGSLLKGSDNNLYGTLSSGPVSNTGAVFKYNYLSNTFSSVHQFVMSEGNNLSGHLVESGTVASVHEINT
ncbi:MAG TPA: hypothetical protein PKM16_11435, partial [Bacteroidia bacterium]|nr:hypothetical protein [Bacteroidia bacterium]